MSSNSADIIPRIEQDFQQLLDYVKGPGSESRSAHQVELNLFRKLLQLGRQLLLLFLVTRAARCSQEPVPGADGALLPYYERRTKTYFSVFGKLQFERPYHWESGRPSRYPLDAELSLPERCYSDLLRDWAEHSSTNESYDETLQGLEHILGLQVSKRALEAAVEEDAQDVEAFYQQKPAPVPEEEGSILVVQVDGKGVPMKQEEPAPGEPRTRKKEAVVTAHYTIAPYRRSAEEVVQALVREQEEEKSDPRARRPEPCGKQVRATFAVKDAAVEQLAKQACERNQEGIHQRVALTDGDPALQYRVRMRFPEFVLVLDVMHMAGYLWDAGDALWGPSHPQRTPWVAEHLQLILEGEASEVIRRLQQRVREPGLSEAQVKSLNTTIGYYQNNLPYMRYHIYLARGLPIATGVVEGACGHLVKDRMEGSGRRWTQEGAQAMLDLRAVRINDDWDEYQCFRRRQQHERRYGTPPPAEEVTEFLALQQAVLSLERVDESEVIYK